MGKKREKERQRERERGVWVMFVDEDESWNVSRSKGVGQGNLLCNLRTMLLAKKTNEEETVYDVERLWIFHGRSSGPSIGSLEAHLQ